MPWPDAEAELVAWLRGVLNVRHCTELPPDLGTILPVNQVQRVGGQDDGFRLDRALVDVDSYAATRAAAWALARDTRHALVTGLRGVTTTAAVFSRAVTVSAPAWRPYENPALRRMGATYEIFLHPVP